MKKIIFILIFIFSVKVSFSNDLTFKIENYENKLIRELTLFFNNNTNESLDLEVWSKNHRNWQKFANISSTYNSFLWNLPNKYNDDEIRIRLKTHNTKQIIAQTSVLIPTRNISLKKSEILEIEIIHNSNFTLSPNPADESIRVSYQMSGSGRLYLRNSLGVDLLPFISLENSTGTENIDISKFPIGIYFITIESDSGINTEKFVVSR